MFFVLTRKEKKKKRKKKTKKEISVKGDNEGKRLEKKNEKVIKQEHAYRNIASK
jgi:hypothetical protein